MSLSPKTPMLAATLAGLALAVPTAAHAADSFVGVSHGNRLVTFHSDTIPGLSPAVGIDGLPGGEKLVALDAEPSGELLALGRSGTLYGVDATHHKVTRTVAGFGAALTPDTTVTLAVAPDGTSARVIADGRDKTLDLTSGAVLSDVAAVADVDADLGADGVLRGVDPVAQTVVTVDAAGAHVVAPLAPVQTHNPTRVTTAADGSTWILTSLGRGANLSQQSRLLRFDPKTGQVRDVHSFLFQQLDAIAATGTVADDKTAPKATVRIPRQSVRDVVKHRGFVAIVTTNEPGQTVMSARLGGSYRGFGFATADHGGPLRVLAYEKRASIRKLAGKRLRLHLAIHDFAGNTKLVDRSFTLGR